MKFDTGDKVRIIKPASGYISYKDSTTDARNSWNKQMDDLNGQVIVLDVYKPKCGWCVPNYQFRVLEDWLELVEVHQDVSSAYDRAMGIL